MKRLLLSLGAAVYTLGVTRKAGDHPGTMQTAGLPDLLVFLPQGGVAEQALVIEAKAPGGVLSLPQRAFRSHCERADIAHVTGGLEHLIEWLIANSYMTDPYTVARRRSGEGTP